MLTETEKRPPVPTKAHDDLKVSFNENAIAATTDGQDGRGRNAGNDQFCAVSKYSCDELTDQDHRLINADYHSPEFSRELWTTIGNGAIWHGEIKHRAKDGSFYSVDTTIVPILNDEGKPRQYIVMRVDLAERRGTNEALRIARAQLGQLLEHSPAVLYGLKVEGDRGVPHLVSESITPMLGVTVGEAMSHGWWLGQLHPDDRERAVKSVAETIRIGANRTEYRLRHKDGHYCWVDDARRVVCNADGVPVELIGVWTDITDRKRAEEIVRQASAHVVRSRRKQVLIELTMLAAATATIYALAARFHWFEGMTRWVLAHSLTQLDEIILASCFFVMGLTVFAFRRWRESESELVSRQQAQAARRLLYEELDQQVKQRTGELSNANRTLHAEVAARRSSGAALTQANERTEAVLAGMADLYFVIDRQWRYIYANAAAVNAVRQTTDEPRDRILGRILWELFPTVVGTELEDQFRRSMEQRVAVNLEFFHVPLGVWWHYRIFPAAGGVAVFANDITASKQAERSLRESEARFRELAENIDEVFWIADPQKTQKLYLSPAFEKIWGRSCQSAYESPHMWLEAVRPEDRERVRQAVQDRQARGTYDEEYAILRPDGNERWIRDRAFPVRDPAGAIKRWVGVAADITEYRLMEEQFRQSQKMEAIGTLAGGIAHDFNNILAAINGYTELSQLILKENPEVRGHLEAVLKASARATDLIRQILTFSRQQPLERRTIQLGPVVAESLALLRATLPSTIEIEMALALDAPTVLADVTQVHQILMNLGTNAWHAMKEHPGRLQVKLERCLIEVAQGTTQPWLRPGLFARVSISDTGCGMDAATRRRIFEPFFTTKAPGEGTGLGLAVVHGIMDSHDGTVTVQSEPGKGTTFHLYFPAHTGETIVAVLKEEPVPRGHGERVLVVDDEELLARLGQKALTALGYEVEFTTKPAMALAMVQADPQRFALVITDQTMPGMTGLVLATQLRTIRPGLPIFLMTGYSLSLTPERLEAAGICQLLLKPTTLHSLGTAVHATLAMQPSR